MKILFLWTGITRCAGDCWRELARIPGVELKIVIDEAVPDAALEREVLGGLDYAFADGGRMPRMADWTPDVLFAVGWHSRAVKEGVRCGAWAHIPKVLCFDMPWRRMFRCFAARFALWRYCRLFSAAYVPGASAARYAAWLGFRRVETGFLAADARRFAPAASATAPENRRGFVYAGRKSPEKRLDVVRRAYGLYREAGGRWEISYVHDVPYAGMPSIFARNACLVLASEHDAWPLVVLEALFAGCEAIVSDRCGNRFDLDVRTTPFGDAEALAREMLSVEKDATGGRAPGLPAESRGNMDMYDSRTWAARTLALAKEVSKWED